MIFMNRKLKEKIDNYTSCDVTNLNSWSDIETADDPSKPYQTYGHTDDPDFEVTVHNSAFGYRDDIIDDDFER